MATTLYTSKKDENRKIINPNGSSSILHDTRSSKILKKCKGIQLHIQTTQTRMYHSVVCIV